MKISGGEKKGHKLLAPKGDRVRPAADKVRQAVFNMLLSQGYPDGARCLDLYCGTGSWGLEALSRGAAYGVFVDDHPASVSSCRENIRHCGYDEAQTKIIRKNILKLGTIPPEQDAFDLVFMDPPYRKDLIIPTLQKLHDGRWLAKGALIVVESESEWAGPHNLSALSVYAVAQTKTYGQTLITLLNYEFPVD